jgi:hypothetical protein
MSIRLFKACIEVVGFDPRDCRRGDADIAMKSLWLFLDQLRAASTTEIFDQASYDASAHTAADDCLEALLTTGTVKVTDLRVLGVLKERLTQSLAVLAANWAAGRSVTLPPSGMTDWQSAFALALLWLHEMELPFQAGSATPPQRLH